ncbi:MAG: hypothetical protein ACREIV_08790 [Planctomycetaceae bacterium]
MTHNQHTPLTRNERQQLDALDAKRQPPPDANLKTARDAITASLARIEANTAKTRAEIARETLTAIRDAVDDPTVHPSIDERIAAAVAAGAIPADELKRTLESIKRQRLAGRIRIPGAYWIKAAQRLCQRHEIPW